MGFASYLEDIQTAKDDVLHRMQVHRTAAERENLLRDVDAHGSTSLCGCASDRAARDALAAAQRLVRTIESRLDQLLDLATDPRFDLAVEVHELRQQQENLRATVARKHEEVARLRQEESDLRERLREAQASGRDARRAQRRAEGNFERLAAANPAAAYDLYTSPRLIAEHKSDGGMA